MKIDIKNRKRYKILMIGRSNWIYCLDTESSSNAVYAVAKPGEEYRGCEDAYFGDINYFRNWFLREYKKDTTLDGTLTARGFKVVGLI